MQNLDFMLRPKRLLTDVSLPIQSREWDFFISSYNDSERVRRTFHNVGAREKRWVVIPEYLYERSVVPENSLYFGGEYSEAELVSNMFERLGIGRGFSGRLCIDITGFLAPHILFIVAYLRGLGISECDFIYSEPLFYRSGERTQFSFGKVFVRLVNGYEGVSNPESSRDFLIVGVGYESSLMSQVFVTKDGATPVHLHALPSLSSDMYQNSMICLDKVSSGALPDAQNFYCPANDPFSVATVVSEIVRSIKKHDPTNIYLCPLATKPQALGFSLSYWKDLSDGLAKIIFPFAESYARDVATGVGKTWLYSVSIDS